MHSVGLQTNIATLAPIAAPIELSDPISKLKSTNQKCPQLIISGGAALRILRLQFLVLRRNVHPMSHRKR